MSIHSYLLPLTLPQALSAAVRRHGDKGLTLLDRRGRKASRRSHAEVLESARRSAGRFASAGVAAGEGVLVSLPTSWDWFEAWLGCLLLGAVPTAVPTGAALGSRRTRLRRLEAIVDLLDCRLVVCGKGLKEEMRCETWAPPTTTAGELRELPVAEVGDCNPAGAEETAFIQLTSGSTGTPRAVEISHRAAIHNAVAMDEVFGAPWEAACHELIDTWVAWLPLHHDMGLVTCLHQLLNGVEGVLMPPEAFLGRPRTWLHQLANGGKTMTIGPNFGYQLCVDRLDRDSLLGLDLSGVMSAMVGAEMVRPDTLQAFADLLAPSGLDPRALRPGYGLAEATVGVTCDRAGSGFRTVSLPAGAGAGLGLTKVVSTGAPLMDTELTIVDGDGTELVEGSVGEVWVRGPGLFNGYLGDREATSETMQAGWLQTGDLGFLLDGELYLTGRIKDILIVHGQNLMPHELEWIAESVAGGGGTERSAAFSVASGGEGEEIVIAVETREKEPDRRAVLTRGVRSAIGRELGLPVKDVVLVRRGQLPKTSSGKIRRGIVRQSYIDGSLPRLRG